jgi:REP element-mobilizing transposase RayT
MAKEAVVRAHGGKRPGAGRKPKGKTALVSHSARPKFARAMPAHVTLKVHEEIPSLRGARLRRAIGQSLEASAGLEGLRVLHFAVLRREVHLIVQADGSERLSRGMQSLNIRLARALNAALDRSGKVYADHYQARLLRTPADLASAIRYLRDNE